jgi:hypothetical protein
VDKELAVTMQQQKEIKAENEKISKQHEKVVMEKQGLDDKILESLSSQTTIEMGAQGVWKITQKLKHQIHDKEIKLGETQNEVARIKVDALNTGTTV